MLSSPRPRHDVLHERIGKRLVPGEVAHVQDGNAPERRDGGPRIRRRVFLGLEGRQERFARVGPDFINHARQRRQRVHLHVGARSAPAVQPAPLTSRRAGNDRQRVQRRSAASGGRRRIARDVRHRVGRNRENNLALHQTRLRSGALFRVTQFFRRGAHDRGDHPGLRPEHERQTFARGEITFKRLVQFLEHEVQDVLRRPDHAHVPLALRSHRRLEHLAGHFEVRGEIRVAVVLLHRVAHITTEHVVHHARAVLVVPQTREKRLDARRVVRGVHRPHLVVRPSRHHRKQVREVSAHVRVRPVEHVHVWNLVCQLQNCLHDV
mmetsp:Transcript_1145/g.4508  ORF Transcript_1145/g.4508 Transcript_1145/m.4508 type:complete len:322 (-) Transcript_1145:1135-2100(-)